MADISQLATLQGASSLQSPGGASGNGGVSLEKLLMQVQQQRGAGANEGLQLQPSQFTGGALTPSAGSVPHRQHQQSALAQHDTHQLAQNNALQQLLLAVQGAAQNGAGETMQQQQHQHQHQQHLFLQQLQQQQQQQQQLQQQQQQQQLQQHLHQQAQHAAATQQQLLLLQQQLLSGDLQHKLQQQQLAQQQEEEQMQQAMAQQQAQASHEALRLHALQHQAGGAGSSSARQLQQLQLLHHLRNGAQSQLLQQHQAAIQEGLLQQQHAQQQAMPVSKRGSASPHPPPWVGGATLSLPLGPPARAEGGSCRGQGGAATPRGASTGGGSGGTGGGGNRSFPSFKLAPGGVPLTGIPAKTLLASDVSAAGAATQGGVSFSKKFKEESEKGGRSERTHPHDDETIGDKEPGTGKKKTPKGSKGEEGKEGKASSGGKRKKVKEEEGRGIGDGKQKKVGKKLKAAGKHGSGNSALDQLLAAATEVTEEPGGGGESSDGGRNAYSRQCSTGEHSAVLAQSPSKKEPAGRAEHEGSGGEEGGGAGEWREGGRSGRQPTLSAILCDTAARDAKIRGDAQQRAVRDESCSSKNATGAAQGTRRVEVVDDDVDDND